jgi:phage shock protein PspC (stress-responsive transcriptional regulator)
MFCRNCQKDIADFSSFCPFCGAPQQAPSSGPSRAPKRLMRSATNRKIAGVCGGIAEYLDLDSTIVRLIWVLLVILPIPLVPAFLGYFVAWLVMPKAPLYGPAASQQPPIIIPNSTQTA